MKHAAQVLSWSGRSHWRGTLVLLVSAWLVPFLVHYIPSFGPRAVGVYLLPAFWSVFVAVYLRGAAVGAAVALVTPLVNLLLTGLPVRAGVATMSLELVAYAMCTAWLVRHWRTLWVVAPLGYLPAKALVIAVRWAVPDLGEEHAPLAHLLGSVQNALPGLGVLLLINLALVRQTLSGADWDND